MDSLAIDNNKTQKDKRTDTLIWILRGIISATFLFSGYTKLHPHIEFFEHDLVNKGITGWMGAHYLSRALISFELFIGVAYLQNHYFRKIIVPASFLLLAAFSVYLSYTLFLDGNKGNCGCFGQILPMTPLQALIKNIVLMGIVAFIYIKTRINSPKWHIPFMMLEAIGFFMLLQFPIPVESKPQPFVAMPLSADTIAHSSPLIPINSSQSDIAPKDDKMTVKPASNAASPVQNSSKSNQQSSPKNNQSTTGNQQLTKTTSPFAKYTTFSDKKATNLDDGVKLIALFDPDCDHCMRAATKIANLRKNGLNLPPMYILFLEGNDDKIPNFFTVTGLNEPYMVVGALDFFQFLKNSPPRVVLLNNGAIAGDWESEDFDEANFKAAVEKSGK